MGFANWKLVLNLRLNETTANHGKPTDPEVWQIQQYWSLSSSLYDRRRLIVVSHNSSESPLAATRELLALFEALSLGAEINDIWTLGLRLAGLNLRTNIKLADFCVRRRLRAVLVPADDDDEVDDTGVLAPLGR